MLVPKNLAGGIYRRRNSKSRGTPVPHDDAYWAKLRTQFHTCLHDITSEYSDERILKNRKDIDDFRRILNRRDLILQKRKIAARKN